jgi:hypothetical protein
MKVFATYRNMDMTEGRGPMVIDKVFVHRPHAEAYIDTKQGVMGSYQKWSAQPHGDWEIKEIEVIEENIVTEAETRDVEARLHQELVSRARAKLSPEERAALGIE